MLKFTSRFRLLSLLFLLGISFLMTSLSQAQTFPTFCGYEFGTGSTVQNEVEVNQIPYSIILHKNARGGTEFGNVMGALNGNGCFSTSTVTNGPCITPSCYISTTNSLYPGTSVYVNENNFTNLRVCGTGTNNLCAAETSTTDQPYQRALTNQPTDQIVRAFVYIHNNATQVENPADAPGTFAYRTAENTTMHLDWSNPGTLNTDITWNLNHAPYAGSTSTTNALSLANAGLQLEPIRIQWASALNLANNSNAIHNNGAALTNGLYPALMVDPDPNPTSLTLNIGDLHSCMSYIVGVYVDFRVVQAPPNYTIEKTAYPAGGTTVYQGEGIQYYVTLTNTGATPLTTTVIDTYDPNTTLVVENPDNPNTIDYGNGTIGLVFENVPAGGTQTISFFVTVNANAPAGQVCNSVTDTAGNISTVCHTVVEIPVDPNFVINKTAATPCYVDGGTIEFSIEVGNEGPGDLNQIVITDPFDTNLAVTSAADITMISAHTNWTVDPFVNPTTGNIDYYQLVVNDVGGDGTLAETEYDTITFSVTVANPVLPNGVTIGNMAWGEAWGVGVRDMLVRNSSNLVTILPCGGPTDYTVTKIGEIFDYPGDGTGPESGLWESSVVPGNPTVYRGDLVRYTLTVTNTLGSAQTIVITDNLPVDVNDNDGDGDTTEPLVTYMPPVTPANITANYNVGPPHTLDVIFTDVPANSSRSLTFFVEVIADNVLNPDNSTFCNNVVGFPSEQVCSEVFGDLDPLFVIIKENSPADCITPGDTITYTITVRNDHLIGDMTNIVIYDDLDDDVTGPSDPVILNFADLAPGETSPPQTITVTVNAGVAVGTVIPNVANGTALWNGQIVNRSNIVYNTVQTTCDGGGGDNGGGGSAYILPTAGVCAFDNQGLVTCQKISVSDEVLDNPGLFVLDAEGLALNLYSFLNIDELDGIKTIAKDEALICEELPSGDAKRECVADWIGRFLGGIACGFPSRVENGQIVDDRPLLDTQGWHSVFDLNQGYQDIPTETILAAQCAGFEVIEEITCDSMNGSAFFADIKKGVYENNDDAFPMPADTLAEKVYKPNNQIVDYEVEVTLGYDAYKDSTPGNRIIIKEGVITIYDYTVPAESIQNEWTRQLMSEDEWNYTGGQQFDYGLMDDLGVLNQENGGVITPTLRYQMDPKLAIRADAGTLKNIAFAVVETVLQPQIFIEELGWVDSGDVIENTYGIGNELICLEGVPIVEDTITNSTNSNNAFVEIIRPFLETMGGANLGLYETTTGSNENLFGQIGEREAEEGFFGGEDLFGGIGKLSEINNNQGQTFIENLRNAATETVNNLLSASWTTTADEMEIYFTAPNTNIEINDTNFITEGKPNGTPVKTLVIDGNLTINSNIALDNDQYVAFIVSGDITIGKDVERLDGIYIAQSTADGTGGGNIISDDISKEQLVVNGSLVGKIEDLAKNRIYIGKDPEIELEPSLIFSYDLRVLEFTPPAIEQFLGEGWGQEGQ